MGLLYVAGCVSVFFYVIMYYALRSAKMSSVTVPYDYDIEAEFSEKVSSRNRTPSFSRVLLFDLLPSGHEENLKSLLHCLAKKNGATHLSSSELEDVPLEGQRGQLFAQTISDMASVSHKPLILDRNHFFIDFERSASLPKVAYAAMVSDPVERFVSQFEQNRLPGHWRPRMSRLTEEQRRLRINALLNSEWVDKNLTQCVMDSDPECVPPPGAIAPSLVSHFCGADPPCRIVNSRTALEQAKFNLETAFSVVGVVGQELDTLRAFEGYLPLFMRNATVFSKMFGASTKAKSVNLPPKVRKKLMKALAHDIELFRFAQHRLFMQVEHLDSKK